ncbi:MAG: SDR family NAD(P)-dependent oxidoreductase [Pseudomonadota bacterium]|nr:SDR family NAD(P)-dependent oxidoreductase [Pseudomonadota bacterium]
MSKNKRAALVTGVGPGLGAAICRRLAREGYRVAGMSRSGKGDAALGAELNHEGEVYTGVHCDVADTEAVTHALEAVAADAGPISVLVHNAGLFAMGPFEDTAPETFEATWRTTFLGAVNCTRCVVPGMLEAGRGVLLYTGATASVKAGGGFSAFASAKFALRGLAQSLAREYGPRGIHVAHIVVDGMIRGEAALDRFGAGDAQCLSPNAIAETYLHLIGQDRSAWTQELDIRPDVETF